MHIVNYSRRTQAVFLVFIIFLIFCAIRLFLILLFQSKFLSGIADKQHNLFVELEPRRGTIYDCNLKPQAVNISMDSLYAAPSGMTAKDKETAIRNLMPILNLNYPYLKERLGRKKAFVWLARKIGPEQGAAIKRLNLKGIGFIKEGKRCYPNRYLASHIIGFAGLDNVGLEGLELYCDRYLKGEHGWAVMLRDARQRKLDIYDRMFPPGTARIWF